MSRYAANTEVTSDKSRAETCREKFREIRMDWSDPRDEIREGLAAISEALGEQQ